MGAHFANLQTLSNEFDYIKLLDLFKNYARPRDQITKLIRSKAIIRVKKGIYVHGTEFRKPYSLEILGNIIYGPSYVSGLSALSYYGLIPERLSVLSSHTPNRNKVFDTPVGRFTYDFLRMKLYQVSVDRAELDAERTFLIATREKALVETLTQVEGIASTGDLRDWFDSMRVDVDVLPKLRVGELRMLGQVFQDHRIELLIEQVRKAKNA